MNIVSLIAGEHEFTQDTIVLNPDGLVPRDGYRYCGLTIRGEWVYLGYYDNPTPRIFIMAAGRGYYFEKS